MVYLTYDTHKENTILFIWRARLFSTFFLIIIETDLLFFEDLIYIYIFLEIGERMEKEKKHQCTVASHMPPTGDLACNLGMCPD